MLRLKKIVKDYPVADTKVRALKGVSLNFRTSEFVSVLGPSGCGKTTLLNIIGGLDKYTSGDLVIGGVSTKKFKNKDWDVYRNHRVGFIFQSYNLIPHQTVLGNVELALTIAGLSKDERRRKAAVALEKVGLKEQKNKYPNQLSGGQCQRVAIARALVNDPEILLADEPTGALDTKTSVQIMELIKQIAKERLVIMVTHNPELAEQYSSRIIKLLDGQVVSDSNPYSESAELDELLNNSIKDMSSELVAQSQGTVAHDAYKARGKERAKMGFFTAFALSLKNLLTKKGRTTMTVFAGSIGIIGVAVVLAFSSGITAYIDSMENDMLSGFPISVSSSTIDLNAIMSLTDSLSDDDEEEHLANKIYVNQVVKTLTSISSINVTNNITEEYISFLKDMPKENYDAMQFRYGVNFAHNIYTEYSYGVIPDGQTAIDTQVTSITGIRSIYTSVLETIDTYKQYANMITNVASFAELPDNEDYIKKQYDVVAGNYPAQNSKDKLVLVLSADDKVDDLILAQLGYVSQREFLNYAYSLDGEGGNEYFQKDKPHMENTYDYSTFVGENSRKFTWYPNDTVYKPDAATAERDYKYQTYKTDEFDGADGKVNLSVACILKPKATVQYGSLSGGMYHTKALTDYIIERESNKDTRSDIVKYALERQAENKDNANANNVRYTDYHFYYDEKDDDTGIITYNVPKNIPNAEFGSNASSGIDSGSSGLGDIASMMSRDQFVALLKEQFKNIPDAMKFDALVEVLANAFYSTSDKVVSLRALGGQSLPSSIYFYLDNFDIKEDLTGYLDKWNDMSNEYITDEVQKIKYTDTLGMIMSMVDMLIMIVTVALIAFTSLALVVSTVMIGIITYVSVVERIKEIGVIRALGGRKKDVKNLFMAETFMLGLGSGLIGIAITYLITGIFNIIMSALFAIPAIAVLYWWQALIMVGISVLLTLISGLSPASAAAKKDPVVALRTE